MLSGAGIGLLLGPASTDAVNRAFGASYGEVTGILSVDEPDSGARPTYASLAHETGLRVTDVTNELAWTRRAFRDIVLSLLREVCASDEEFRAEARDLLGIDA